LPAGGDTPDIDAYVERILTYIEQECGIENFKKRIKVQNRFTPDDFMNKFNSWQGSALGLAHTLRQSAFFRPSVKSKKISNLYYVGANVQPGIGLPMCLISAEVALRQIQKDLVSK
jgi:phytoene dehydrogenase-like protein